MAQTSLIPRLLDLFNLHVHVCNIEKLGIRPGNEASTAYTACIRQIRVHINVCTCIRTYCTCSCMHCTLACCRPEADDVHALQQQLSSLHLVMEQSSSEHDKQLLQVSEEKKQAEREKEMLSQQLESLREEVKGLPRKEELTK